MISLLPLLVLHIIFSSFLHFTQALPKPSNTSSTSLVAKNDVRNTGRKIFGSKYLKNCQGLVDREAEAWSGAETLAKAALMWKPGSTYQPAADFWFGKDSALFPFSGRIQKNFKNAAAARYELSRPLDGGLGVQGQFGDEDADIYLEIYCREDGPDGKVPAPDGSKNWDSKICNDKAGPFAYWGKRSHWYWYRDVHMIVFCQKAWNGKTSLADLEAELRKMDKDKINADQLSNSLASTYLHEMMHMVGVISNPEVTDVYTRLTINIISAKDAALARWYGCATEVPDNKGGYHGEHGTTINANSYMRFANSLYWQELLKIATPPEPDPKLKWKTFPKWTMSPVPPSERPKLTDAESSGLVFNETDIGIPGPPAHIEPNSDTPQPVLPTWPRVPFCTTNKATTYPKYMTNLAAVFCDRVSKLPAAKSSLNTVLTEKDLKPPIKGATVIIDFLWEQSQPLSSCLMGCSEVYSNLTLACQYDSHTIRGSGGTGQSCGTFQFQVIS